MLDTNEDFGHKDGWGRSQDCRAVGHRGRHTPGVKRVRTRKCCRVSSEFCGRVIEIRQLHITFTRG